MKMNSRKPKPTSRSATDVAVGLLARREHSVSELKRKLREKGCVSADVDDALRDLQNNGLLSDQRFAEAYVNMRKNKGYGPMRILAELREKGVAADVAESWVYHPDHDWSQVLQQLYQRKYSATSVADFQDKGKRIASLQARGFSLNAVIALVKLDVGV